MRQLIYNEPPEPPAGASWCIMCLMLAKAEQTADAQLEAIAAEGGAEQGPPHYVPFPASADLRTGDYRGVCDIQGLGVVDVCWQHIGGFRLQRVSRVATANGPMPPGLIRGKG